MQPVRQVEIEARLAGVRFERWVQVDSPAGPLPALLPPGSNNRYAPRMDAVPALGQHTQAVLEELGFGAGEIEGWRREGVI